MRLYLKFFALLLAAGTLQWAIGVNAREGTDLWFNLRCQLAHVTGDTGYQDRLIQEQYERRLAASGMPDVTRGGFHPVLADEPQPAPDDCAGGDDEHASCLAAAVSADRY
ncbi:MAG TPA: hypothetical protein VER17_03100 [Tepidisphaeraceae bacterium]|nr:hypothetical protein [Tepidisphaeraceae bacterium]